MMKRPYNEKTDPVPILVMVAFATVLIGGGLIFAANHMRSARATVERAMGWRILLLQTNSPDAVTYCGSYIVPPDKRAWRYLADRQGTWVEGQAPTAVLPAAFLAAYDQCEAYRATGRWAGMNRFTDPLVLALANSF